MIFDVFKNGEYKEHRITTMVKDIIISTACGFSIYIGIIMILSFFYFDNYFVYIIDNDMLWPYLRTIILGSFIISVIFNDKSHKTEIRKYQEEKNKKKNKKKNEQRQ